MESNRNFKSEVSTWNPATQITGTLRAPTPPLRLKPQQIKNQSPYYWNWNLFNLFRVQNVTYTETKTEYVTTKVQDPHTVVSFYIKGCRPSKPPFNLPECTKLEQVQQEEKSLLVLAPLKFVSSVDEMITPTKSAFNSENATELNQTTLENN